jgi:hypothetical protein
MTGIGLKKKEMFHSSVDFEYDFSRLTSSRSYSDHGLESVIEGMAPPNVQQFNNTSLLSNSYFQSIPGVHAATSIVPNGKYTEDYEIPVKTLSAGIDFTVEKEQAKGYDNAMFPPASQQITTSPGSVRYKRKIGRNREIIRGPGATTKAEKELIADNGYYSNLLVVDSGGPLPSINYFADVDVDNVQVNYGSGSGGPGRNQPKDMNIL